MTKTNGKLPEFDVASIRPSGPKDNIINALLTYPGGRILARGCTLQYLVMEAFHLQEFQISGGPNWIRDERFEIEAKPPVSSASFKSNPAMIKLPPNDEQRQMLQALLIDRFQLKFHRENKEGKIFVLTANDKHLKLQAPRDKNEYPWAGNIVDGDPDSSGLRGTNISMPQLAERLTAWLEHPVVNQTGLTGSFDFEFQTGDKDTSSSDVASTIITSLKGIGLNLKEAKGPVEAVVIDSVQQPSAN
ncbi:TIGR03435 family protein [Acidicapsa ligni]|uniref:TIGR03435 family protein n=1 Tax=Acidicapsa ligni TaxID=542300 RepID=UPI0021E03976|nr:TIGR03435 family protein [Acidicapsa ligni]